MTTLFNPLFDEDVREEPAAMSPTNNEDRMTILEVELATALWQHGRVKLPKNALQRVALDLAEHTNPEQRQTVSEITWGEFYNGAVGVPRTALVLMRERPSPFQQSSEDYKGGSCI